MSRCFKTKMYCVKLRNNSCNWRCDRISVVKLQGYTKIFTPSLHVATRIMKLSSEAKYAGQPDWGTSFNETSGVVKWIDTSFRLSSSHNIHRSKTTLFCEKYFNQFHAILKSKGNMILEFFSHTLWLLGIDGDWFWTLKTETHNLVHTILDVL